MKFKWKIVLLCVIVYFVSISFVALAVTEQIYVRNLNSEIDRCLHEHSNIYSSVSLYLMGSKMDNHEGINIMITLFA